jgi:hypothetical protein
VPPPPRDAKQETGTTPTRPVNPDRTRLSMASHLPRGLLGREIGAAVRARVDPMTIAPGEMAKCAGCGGPIEEGVRWTIAIGPAESQVTVPVHRDNACWNLYSNRFWKELDKA